MKLGEFVVDRLEDWEPGTRFQKERTFQEAMANYLNHVLSSTEYEAHTEDRLQIDIAVGKPVGIELKHSPNANEIDRLNGQIDRYKDGFNTVIVAVFGSKHSRWEQLPDSHPSVHFMHFWKGGNSYSGPTRRSQTTESTQSNQTHPAFEGWM